MAKVDVEVEKAVEYILELYEKHKDELTERLQDMKANNEFEIAEEFLNRYSPDALARMTDEEKIEALVWKNGTKKSMYYELERGAYNSFGSLFPNQHGIFIYPIRLDKKGKFEIRRKSEPPAHVSKERALKEMNQVIYNLKRVEEKLLNASEERTVEFYKEIYKTLKESIHNNSVNILFNKYLGVAYPNHWTKFIGKGYANKAVKAILGFEIDDYAKAQYYLFKIQEKLSDKNIKPMEFMQLYHDYIRDSKKETLSNKEQRSVSEASYSKFSKRLLNSKNIILHGAPGTGKTYLAKEIAAELVSKGRTKNYSELTPTEYSQIGFVQFHPSYDYTDFVEGYRPVINADTDDMKYVIKNGHFKQFVDTTKASYKTPNKDNFEESFSDKIFVFIIDEINRGEISKIFGELFFALDPDYRGKKGSIRTQYSVEDKALFYIPENVYIIGTMNDIDRSVESFDFAMRRRFRFLQITADSTKDMLNTLVDKEEAVRRMQSLNRAIDHVEGLNTHYHIGPSYFLKLEELNEDYETLWSDYLKPLLEEYVRGFYNEEELIEMFKNAYNLEEANETY